jgi:selenocysteine-specific elongation factor
VTVVVGTAGHIDHGKSALLQALTGIDPDRLPEERRRGMTIDVGYAHLRLDDGSEIDFVDVPGHDRLVGNMLVGAGEIDATLLAVAADDGPRAQTLEHLELLDALGIADGIAVVTKTDAVEASRARSVGDETRRLLQLTSLAGAPIVLVSATTGAGLPELRTAIVGLRDRLTARSAPARAPIPAQLAIDRVFSVKGRGAVVTGTLRGGTLERGMTLRLVPGPGLARVREVQVHGETVERAIDGGRVALNLGAVDATDLHRGMVLTAGDLTVTTDRVLVALRPSVGLVSGAAAIPGDLARVRLHAGTDQLGATVGRSGRDSALLPGGEVSAILRLERPAALAPGDRFVLRRPSPSETLAGGRILDVDPPRGVSRRRMTPERLGRLASAVPGRGGDVLEADSAAARLDLHGAIVGRPVALAPDVARQMDEAAIGLVASADALIPLTDVRAVAAIALRRLANLPADPALAASSAAIDRLVDDGKLVRHGDRIGLAGRAAPEGPDPRVLAAMDRLEDALGIATPPSLTDAARAAGCPADGVRELERSGRIIRVGNDLAYAAATYRAFEAQALAMAAAGPLTPAAFRDATGTSRKYVMALLEELDRRGVLRQTPDGHLPGPRAAAAAVSGR